MHGIYLVTSMHYALQAVAALQSAKTIRDLEESLLQARGLVGIEEDVADARARLSAMTEAIVIPYLPSCLFWHDAPLPPSPQYEGYSRECLHTHKHPRRVESNHDHATD